MMNIYFCRRALLILGALVIISTGCARSKVSRFYTLTSSVPSETKSLSDPSSHDLAIGIGPIVFPEYLDRPQIVTRAGRNELKIAEFHRWAGSLRDEFCRALAENLSALLSTDRISIYPWKSFVPIDYQVDLHVTRFDGEIGGNIILSSRFNILGGSEKKALLSKNSKYTEFPQGESYEALVAAQNRALVNLSAEIARAII
ncbi:MAG: PqiC family protein, partial [Thermodesulfobacteriota bacterium]|nr:PqiC family protein [Thermodesulfobacteriota bacterium]